MLRWVEFGLDQYIDYEELKIVDLFCFSKPNESLQSINYTQESVIVHSQIEDVQNGVMRIHCESEGRVDGSRYPDIALPN